jgi:glutamate-1-semialdehyde aminotransferase
MIKKFSREKVHEHLVVIGEAVQTGWQKMAKKHGLAIDVGGIAPLSHFSFRVEEALFAKAYFVQLMLDEGFLASTNFYSMHAHTPDHVESYIAAVDGAFEAIARALASGNLSGQLRGAPAASGFKRLA